MYEKNKMRNKEQPKKTLDVSCIGQLSVLVAVELAGAGMRDLKKKICFS
jgi:hypothetical protein